MRKNVLLLSVCQAMMNTGISLIIATAALVGYALAEDKSLATLPLALQLFAGMCATIPASFLMDRIGRRAGFQIGAALGLCGAIISTFAIVNENFFWFCFGAVPLGLFRGFAVYYRLAAVDHVTPEFKPRAISYVMAGGVVAAFLGPNLATVSANWISGATFAGSYLALSSVYILSILVLAGISMPRKDTRDDFHKGRKLKAIMRQPRFIVAAVGGMLGYSAMSLIMTATPLSMKNLALSFGDVAFVIQWHVFAMFAPSFFTGNLINRFGVLRIMVSGVVMNLLCVAVNIYDQSLINIWIALFLLGVGWNFLFVGATTLLTETYRLEERAKTQAANDFLVITMVTLTVFAAGPLEFYLGWRTVNIFALPMVFTILAVIIWLNWHERNKTVPAEA